MLATACSFLVAALLCVHTDAVQLSFRTGIHTMFDEFTRTYGRKYAPNSTEYLRRHRLFEQRVADIEAKNSREDALWHAGINEFTDWTDDELWTLRGWRGGGRTWSGAGHASLGLLEIGAQPPLQLTADWRHLKSLVVRDQSSCGSCWAFAAANMLSAHYEIHTNTTRTFSVQQLVDCVPNPQKCGGTGGCQGATVELAMDYAHKIGLANLRTLDELPYLAEDQACPPESLLATADIARVASYSKQEVQLLSFQTLASNEPAPLMRALMEGPVAISVAAETWFTYEHGIFNDCVRDSIIDHAVLAVGYGQAKTAGPRLSFKYTKYWTIQNSWSASWGEKGYIRVYRGDTLKQDQNHCGTDNRPEDGIACEPYPKEVTVCGMCGLLYDSVAARFGRPNANAKLAGKAKNKAKVKAKAL